MPRPEPVLPDFDGASLPSLVPALAEVLAGGPGPDWLPSELAGAAQIVLLVLDGLGAEQLAPRAAQAPALSAAPGTTLTSVAPSTTACALTSLTTGLPPAVHGLLGYRLAQGDQVLNALHWRLAGRDARRLLPAPGYQPHPVFPGLPGPVPVVTRADYAQTGFTAAHLGGTELRGVSTPSGLAVEVARALGQGAPFVYAYHDGVDRVAHASGLGDLYQAELVAADRLVADMAAVLPPGAALVVTADHGQVDVGPAIEVLGPEVMDGVTLLSGEGRFRWLHVRPGAADEVAAAALAAFGEVAWIRTRDELVDHGWLGGEPVPTVMDRLGDVALIPFEPLAFLDPADTGEQRLKARHGSLTAAEMLVPLRVLRP